VIADSLEAVTAKDTTDGVVIGDLWGYISDVNDVVVKWYGANDKSEFVGKHVLEFLMKEERSRAVQESLNSIVSGHERIREYRVRSKTGEELTLNVTISYIRDKDGQKIGFIDIIKNISDQ
jgi:PAS domain S-box-containing protein